MGLTFKSRQYFCKCIATCIVESDYRRITFNFREWARYFRGVDNTASVIIFTLAENKFRGPKLCKVLSTQDRGAMRVFRWTDHLWKIYVKIYPCCRKRRKPLKRVTMADKGNRKTTYVVAWLELLWTWSIDADNCCLFRHVTCNLETRKKTKPNSCDTKLGLQRYFASCRFILVTAVAFKPIIIIIVVVIVVIT